MSQSIIDLINAAAYKYDVPNSIAISVAKHESNFDPNAVSRAGAQGVMQLMPATASWLGVTNSFDPVQNIDAGVKYLGNLFKQFGDWSLALAAYNAGPGNVTKYGGIPPFPETQQYVTKITQDVGLTTDETPIVGNSEVGAGTVVTLGMTLALAVIGWLVVRS